MVSCAQGKLPYGLYILLLHYYIGASKQSSPPRSGFDQVHIGLRPTTTAILLPFQEKKKSLSDLLPHAILKLTYRKNPLIYI